MLTHWICAGVLLVSLLLLLRSLWRRRKGRRLPPGPAGLPIVGYLPWLDPKEPHLSLTRLTEKYGRICGLWMGSVYTVLVADPRIVREALAKSSASGRAPLFLTHGIMQGYGLICSEGELWKEQRRFVTTCLKNFGMVKYGPQREKMKSTIVEFVDEALTALTDESRRMSRTRKWNSGSSSSSGGAIDPSPILHHCLGNFMNKLVFGKVYEEKDETWKWLRDIQEEGVRYIGIAGPLNFLPFLRILPRFKKVMRMLKDGQSRTHREYAKLIEKHRVEKGTGEKSFLSCFDDEMKSRDSRGDPGSFTESQYHHLLADLYGAGVDTTVATLRWFLLYMAVHREEQDKVYREMMETIGERAPKLEDRSRLIRLEASIAEVQRLRSVVPVGIPHGTTEDTTIGDYEVPKGTMIVPLQWAIHMDSEYWEDPRAFNPDRFISEDGSLAKPEAFLPFQSGKRMCVGDELARMLLFLFAGGILSRFAISVPPDDKTSLDGDCGITLVPKPHRLIFAPRCSDPPSQAITR